MFYKGYLRRHRRRLGSGLDGLIQPTHLKG